ncbi:WbqC family protein [Streptomyces sp. NPDC046887]|uniref:WbqC family protein n=1 Tax=Streptomyces sp. NPDC046887 TaxID=3155472 RepID=UPI0033E8F680
METGANSKRMTRLLQQYYGKSPFWSSLDTVIGSLLDVLGTPDRTALAAEASTQLLLDLLGWRGSVIRSSARLVRNGRSERLADLAKVAGADSYLCGTGGARYLRSEPFDAHGINVTLFRTPTTEGAWAGAREISALWALAMYGPDLVAGLLCGHSAAQPTTWFELRSAG